MNQKNESPYIALYIPDMLIDLNHCIYIFILHLAITLWAETLLLNYYTYMRKT